MAVNVVYQDKGNPYDKVTPVRTFYEGLSVIGGDTKPVDCNKGSEYRELDTMDLYGFDGENWIVKELGANLLHNPIFDNAGRISNNSVFGEKLTGVRKPTVATQFQYGFDTYETNLITANGGQVLNTNSLLVTSTGANVAGSAKFQTKRALRYLPGSEAYIFFTSIFSAGKSNSYQRIGLCDSVNGFHLGYEGSIFGFTKLQAGTPTFTPQSEFNLDKLNGLGKSGFNLNPQLGNVFAIKFGYLGFANITLEVLTTNGEWVPCHRINYPNTSTIPHILSSMLPVKCEVANTGNNTDIRLSCGSFSAGVVDGAGTDPSVRPFSSQLPTATISTTSGVLATFRNKTDYNSITNYIPAVLDLISVAVDGNKNMIIQLWKNPTITNSPTWVGINANSTLERSINATITPETGQLLISANIQKVGDFFQFVSKLNFFLYPGEYAAFVWSTSSGVSSQIDLGIRWTELF